MTTEPAPTAPDAPPARTCAVMDVHRRFLSELPGYAEARSAVENLILDALAAPDALASDRVYRIPVVVHVVHAEDSQDVSRDQVDSQIDVLNADFRASNPDTSIVPGVFSGLVADSRVEFVLADTDPDGNPTEGITRRRTEVASFSSDDAVKFDAQGGTDAWPTDRYLNLWVAPLGGGLLGYAQFPGGPAETDGVVVTTKGFGTLGTATAPFDLGRTATHEVGHYLNLFHIWGDDGTGCGGSDEVPDTPNQAGPNTGVPDFPHVTCKNGPNGDLFYDYMDYTDDRGMVMFTHGQAARMQACLETARFGLAQVLDPGGTAAEG